MEYKVRRMPLPDVLDFIVDNRGKTVPTDNKGKIILIATNCIRNESLFPKYEKVRYLNEETYNNWFRAHPKPGDIIFVNKGTPGRVCLVPEPVDFCIAQDMMAFRVNDDIIYNKYLLAFLRSREIQNQIQVSQVGTTIPHFKKEQLKEILVPIRDYKEQKKIGDLYYKISYKIELNNQINDNLYEITNKLYEQLFVVERQDDWKEYNLQELMDISNGYSYTGKELVDTSVVGMATIKNFERTGGFKEEGFKDIEPIKAKDNHYADKFDILVACTDLTQNADIIGNAVMLLNTGKYEKVVISMDLVKILPKKNKYLVFSILNSKEFKNFALGYKTGTTVLHLNKNCFKDFNIKLPDLSKLDEFEKVVEVNYKKISSNLEENNTLTQLRDTLLPKLMNGEIDLDKIEI